MTLFIFRISHALWRLNVPFFPRFLYVINRMLFGVVLPPSAQIGRSVVIGYQGLGTVVHADSIIGDRVVISSNVTIGGRSGRSGVPVIGNDVEIGSGARILGPITIGSGAKIGANAVVINDVPENSVAVGVPARVLVDGINR